MSTLHGDRRTTVIIVYPKDGPTAHSTQSLLLDLIEGDPPLFVRRYEVEAQWTWIDRIREAWASKGITPRPYAAGTWGPSAAIALTERDGISLH